MEPSTTTKCNTLAIVLPSGVGISEFSLRVVEVWRQLDLTVTWPIPLCDIAIMYQKWLTVEGAPKMEQYQPKMGQYQPKYIVFENSLKAYREHCMGKI